MARGSRSMSSKETARESARAGIAGVNTLAKHRAVTLGPKGRNVVLQKSFGSPL